MIPLRNLKLEAQLRSESQAGHLTFHVRMMRKPQGLQPSSPSSFRAIVAVSSLPAWASNRERMSPFKQCCHPVTEVSIRLAIWTQ